MFHIICIFMTKIDNVDDVTYVFLNNKATLISCCS